MIALVAVNSQWESWLERAGCAELDWDTGERR